MHKEGLFVDFWMFGVFHMIKMFKIKKLKNEHFWVYFQAKIKTILAGGFWDVGEHGWFDT